MVDDYEVQAQKIVRKFARKDIIPYILNNEDHMQSIISNMMLADTRYDPNHNKGAKKSSFRVLYARYAILTIVSQYKQLLETEPTLSYSHVNFIVPDGKDYSRDVDDRDEIEYLLSTVPEKYNQVLRMRYLEDKKLHEIAKILKLSKWAVSLRIRKGLELLKQNV